VTDYVVGFGELGRADVPRAGGKGASLGELTRAGIPVPPGCVVTTNAFELVLNTVDPGGRIRSVVDGLDAGDRDAIARAAQDIRAQIATAPLPGAIRDAIVRHCHAFDGEGETPGSPAPVAVRSSATGEDGADASFAGLQDTYLWIRGEDEVCDAVRRCWASLYSVESLTYRRRLRLPEQGLAMAVVIQRMVDARCAGVMFTRSPLTGDRSVIVLEASWGLGSALVGGAVTPDRYVVNKVTGEILSRAVARKLRQHRMDPSGTGVREEDVTADLRDKPCLDDEEIRALARLGRRIEQHYGCPQDIEWAIARNLPPGAEVFALQSRPETVWATKEKAPVARPKARAFDHVLNRLGGAQ
jgi:pyruvate,water dikinase